MILYILIILFIIVMFTPKHIKEHMTASDLEIDTGAIRNLSNIATTLMTPEGTLTNPGSLNITNNLNIKNDLNVKNNLNVKNQICIDGVCVSKTALQKLADLDKNIINGDIKFPNNITANSFIATGANNIYVSKGLVLDANSVRHDDTGNVINLNAGTCSLKSTMTADNFVIAGDKGTPPMSLRNHRHSYLQYDGNHWNNRTTSTIVSPSFGFNNWAPTD